MFDPATLAASAIGILVSSLGKAAKAAAEDLSAAIGEKIATWIKTKIGSVATEEAISDIKANPQDEAAQLTLRGQLLKRLREDESLCEELAKLIGEAEQAGYSVKQEHTVSGDKNIVVEIAGEQNVVKIGGVS